MNHSSVPWGTGPELHPSRSVLSGKPEVLEPNADSFLRMNVKGSYGGGAFIGGGSHGMM